mgnify:FL=1
MSHDLDESTGKPAMAYVGERPWHGLGEALPPDQDIETWVKAARLDWEIERLPVNYQMGGRNHVMRDRFVLARSDTQTALSVVSGDYQVVQPKDVLEFYRDLVSAPRRVTDWTAPGLEPVQRSRKRRGNRLWSRRNPNRHAPESLLKTAFN